ARLEVQSDQRLSRRLRPRLGDGTQRSPMPRHHYRRLFRPRAFHQLVEERLRARLAAHRKAASSKNSRRADNLRAARAIQSQRSQAPTGEYLLGIMGLRLDADRGY